MKKVVGEYSLLKKGIHVKKCKLIETKKINRLMKIFHLSFNLSFHHQNLLILFVSINSCFLTCMPFLTMNTLT